MGFIGNIQYNLNFIINAVLGIVLLLPYLYLVVKFSYSMLAKIVLTYGGMVYVAPFFIVQDWANHPVGIDHLIVTYIFMLEYFVINKLLSQKVAKYEIINSRIISVGQKSSNYVSIFTLIALIFWTIYFIVNPSYSALFLYFTNIESSDSVRFAFYQTPGFMQLFYAITGRILIPLGLMFSALSGKFRNFILIFMLSIFVLLQSGERQNILLMIFCMLFLAFVPSGMKKINIFLLLTIVPILLFLVFSMQGNIAAEEENYFMVFHVLFSRVIIDPFYMFSYIFETYKGDLMYGGTNKIFYFLGTDNFGWTAIGIIPDAWINFGYLGIFLAPAMYAILLMVAAYFVRMARRNFGIFLICNLLYCIAFISLYYSNLFSLVPMFVYMVACLISIISMCNRSIRGEEFNPHLRGGLSVSKAFRC